MAFPPSIRLVCLVVLLLLPLPAAAQPTPGDRMADRYLAEETARLSSRFLDGATTRAEWEARRPRLKQEYLSMLGLWPLPERTPLHATVTGTLERDGVVVEKLHFQSRPGLYVTGNLYRPKATEGRPPASRKLPAVLYVCGHSGRGRNGNKTAFQDHGLWCATNGYVCLVIDTLQLGEIPGIHHGTYREGRWWWQAAGYTPAGVECWNGIRALDYLVSRPDVDPERLTVTGISGGGAATYWIAAADERVRCAVPVSGMSDLESYVTNKVINGHCDCMFLLNTYGWEWTTIAALVAPRPLLFANSDNDRIFPMDGNRRIIERLRTLYGMYGKPELVDEYVSKGGHDYRPDLRIAIFQWINQHIKNDTAPVRDADFQPFPNEQLRAFPEDRDVPANAINGTVDEVFVPRAQVQLPEPGKFEEWKRSMLQRLRERSFRGLPERAAAVKLRDSQEPQVQGTFPLGARELPYALRQPGRAGRGLLVVTEGAATFKVPSWSEPFARLDASAAGTTACCLFPLWGTGATAWTRRNPPNYVERAHALLGQTVDRVRVEDLARMARSLDERFQQQVPWTIAGQGQGGILAAYAALWEPSIQEVIVVDPPASHRDGPTFLNVLGVLDIPEALGLLAPRPLTLVNAKDPAFDRTAALYRLAGAEGKLRRR